MNGMFCKRKYIATFYSKEDTMWDEEFIVVVPADSSPYDAFEQALRYIRIVGEEKFSILVNLRYIRRV